MLEPLGKEQLLDPALAVIELVKNAWDADARSVKVDIRTRENARIVVSDDGLGMTRDDFLAGWLVIGASSKRRAGKSAGGRPLFGEKGLGRLSTFALGDRLKLRSRRAGAPAFCVDIDWQRLRQASSFEDYVVDLQVGAPGPRGTRIEVHELRVAWTAAHTDLLVAHAAFLAAQDGPPMTLSLYVDGVSVDVDDPLASIARSCEASVVVEVLAGGVPQLVGCEVRGANVMHTPRRAMPAAQRDPRLAGARLCLRAFAARAATRAPSLAAHEVSAMLERCHGVRVYRDGVGIPPYGLRGDDWAGLDSQHCAAGGASLVPANGDVVGELHVSRAAHPHLVVAAGRAGIADQAAVDGLAGYVRWAARHLGAALRTARPRTPSGLDAAGDDGGSQRDAALSAVHDAIAALQETAERQADEALTTRVARLQATIDAAQASHARTLALYAQLAAAGLAATSFSHELRGDFVLVTEALRELVGARTRPDPELLAMLGRSWRRIGAFATMFQVLPAKQRRKLAEVDSARLEKAVHAMLALAPEEQVVTTCDVSAFSARIVAAEFDAICVNLVSNALKALHARKVATPGRLRVLVRPVGEDLELRVADTGCGIDPGVRRVMMEPVEGAFAEGTGMGLSIVRFITERYGGCVEVCQPSAGFVTEFRVLLRRVIVGPAASTPGGGPTGRLAPPHRGECG
ncbi:MAG: ATP-binding protein [Gammaproteobacteria bacterium]